MADISEETRLELAALLREKGWTQDQLAARAQVSTRTVWAALHGQPIRLEKLEAIRDALGLRPAAPEPSWVAAMVRYRIEALRPDPEAQERYIAAVVWLTALDPALLPERPASWTNGNGPPGA